MKLSIVKIVYASAVTVGAIAVSAIYGKVMHEAKRKAWHKAVDETAELRKLSDEEYDLYTKWAVLQNEQAQLMAREEQEAEEAIADQIKVIKTTITNSAEADNAVAIIRQETYDKVVTKRTDEELKMLADYEVVEKEVETITNKKNGIIKAAMNVDEALANVLTENNVKPVHLYGCVIFTDVLALIGLLLVNLKLIRRVKIIVSYM